MMPLVAAVWSSSPGRRSREYPARYLFRFLAHHGMLTVSGSPRWRTVVGGAALCRARRAKGLAAMRETRRRCPCVDARPDVVVGDPRRRRRGAASTAWWSRRTPTRRCGCSATRRRRSGDVLGAFRYSTNETVLHTDGSVLRATGARGRRGTTCSTPARRRAAGARQYDMNRLQRTRRAGATTASRSTGRDAHRPGRCCAGCVYEHPVYTPESLDAQRRLPRLNTAGHAFCRRVPRLGLPRGRLRVRGPAAAGAGVRLVTAPPPSTRARSCTRRRVRRPLRVPATGVYMWLVDLDDLPRLPRRAASAAGIRRARPSRRPGPLDPRQRRRVPGRQRRRPRAAAGS